MGSVLSVDDIEPGQMVALHSFLRNPNVMEGDENYGVPSPTGQVPMGVPMRVKGMSLPFVACELISPEGEEIGPAIVDVRRVRVCELDEEYVNAIVNPNRKKTEEESLEDDVPF